MEKFRETVAVYDAVAKLYLEKFGEMRIYDHTYDAFLQLLPENARVLEFGCGPGMIAKYLLSKNSSLDIVGIDASREMISLAKQNVPGAKFEVGDCRKPDTFQKYDGIIAGFVVPYLDPSENAKFIEDCATMLDPQGILYISLQEASHLDSGYKHSSDGRHKLYMHYYLQADACGWLENAKMELLETFRIAYGTPDEPDTHLVMIAKNG